MQAGILMGNLTNAIGSQAGAQLGSGTVRHEEAALVAALKAGSDEAFALLIAQYSQPLFTLIARSLQDPADAADITQEVFIKVFRSVRSFHGESSLRTWMYRIALHEASNQRRWWKRHKKQELTIDTPLGMAESDDGDESLCLGATLADAHVSPLQQAEHGELKARVEEALRKLPEAFRTVVVLREMEGFSYEEIAEIVQVPAGTVKSRLMRGRAALKEILVAEGLGKMLSAADRSSLDRGPR